MSGAFDTTGTPGTGARGAPGAGAIAVEGLDFKPVLQVTDSLYEISAPGFDGATVHIRQDGKVWITRPDAGPARPSPVP